MNPIYSFQLSRTYNGATIIKSSVNPIYDDSLAIEWNLESSEQYYRSELSGKLKFVRDDYDWINQQNFEAQFKIIIKISRNGGTSFDIYWTGTFYKTDCEWDVDNKCVTVTPTVLDQYSEVLAGIDKEYNLIELAPEINNIKIDKRPMIQVYSPGESVVACFLSGMYWEQDCEATDSPSTYHFGEVKKFRKFTLSGGTYGGTDTPAMGVYFEDIENLNDDFEITRNGFTFKKETYTVLDVQYWRFKVYPWGMPLSIYWQKDAVVPSILGNEPYEGLTLDPVSASASGTVTVTEVIRSVYARIVLDTDTFGSRTTEELDDDDIVSNNRNYKRCLGMGGLSGMITVYQGMTTTPTKYGIYQPGQYYDAPYELGAIFSPVAKSLWDELSIWYREPAVPLFNESLGRKEYTLRDAYPIESVISVLLGKIDSTITHQGTTDYSQILYGSTLPISKAWKLHITPKSNILAGNYDQPAQKAPITLRQVLDMLRDCFRCYWYIENNKLKIEHVSYFLKGKMYSGTPQVGVDLTAQEYTRNGKKWAFGTSKFDYDKVEMPERYEFGWMDDVTELFEGYPIEIQSGFVKSGEIETIDITNYTSDVDYMLLNPSACDEDGFALLAPLYDSTNEEYKLPYLQFTGTGGITRYLQNGYMAFYSLMQYYMYDMPSWSISAQGVQTSVRGVKKQKRQEDVVFPLLTEPDLYKLIKTNLGSGRIEKLSINLSSRKIEATLQYDTV